MHASERDRESYIVADPMYLSDVPAVLVVERASFSSPWPARAYRYEIARNDRSRYFVLCYQKSQPVREDTHLPDRNPSDKGLLGFLSRLRPTAQGRSEREVVGYGGFWITGYQAHVSTLAVAPQWRRKGLGLLLMLHMLDCAVAMGMRTVTLEVRVSNHVAQSLYQKCGFRTSGVNKGYYRDNGEDALLMMTRPLTNPAYRAHLDRLWEELHGRLGHRIARESQH